MGLHFVIGKCQCNVHLMLMMNLTYFSSIRDLTVGYVRHLPLTTVSLFHLTTSDSLNTRRRLRRGGSGSTERYVDGSESVLDLNARRAQRSAAAAVGQTLSHLLSNLNSLSLKASLSSPSTQIKSTEVSPSSSHAFAGVHPTSASDKCGEIDTADSRNISSRTRFLFNGIRAPLAYLDIPPSISLFRLSRTTSNC